MGTVGLSFGSATSGQGFDVSTTVTQILSAEHAIETPWKNQLTALQSQDTVLSTLGTDLSTLTTDMQTLSDFNSVLSQKQGRVRTRTFWRLPRLIQRLRREAIRWS